MKSRLRWSLQIATYDLPRAHVVALTGRVGATTAAKLASALNQLTFDRSARVLLDVAGVDYISSAGLQLLEKAATRARAAEGTFLVCGLQDPVRVSLEVSGAAAQLDIAESVTQAAEQLGTAP